MNMLILVAQFERELTSVRTRENMRARASVISSNAIVYDLENVGSLA